MTNNTIAPSPYLPFDPKVFQHNSSFGHLLPWEFNGWKKETDSWKTGCYLHAGLNPAMPLRLTGPSALQLLKDACINGFAKFSIGCSKHAVMCNDKGNVMADGIVMRLDEEVFMTFYLSPYLEYLVASGRYDARVEDMSGKTFLFQVAGPKSLEVLEAATGESLRDIEFLWHRPSQIEVGGGKPGRCPVRVFRLGVARTLAYEVHGDIKDALPIYDAIIAAGKSFGIERLGLQAYGMNHTEGGFAQSFIHFLPAWPEDAQFFETIDPQYKALFDDLKGSAGSDVARRFANPLELGWGHMMKFDHTFSGDAALKAAQTTAQRQIVTLRWNEEDILDVYASQFREGEEFQFMDFPANPVWQQSISIVIADEVCIDGRRIGISSGRIFSHYYKAMLSLGLVEESSSALGTEVEILWGKPGGRQKKIRATVSRYPYLDIPFNKEIDVRN